MTTPKILIAGAGAIGSVTAILLQKNGFAPYLLSKYDDIREISSSSGLKVTGHCGDLSEKVEVITPEKIGSQKFDVIMIATKATDLKQAAKQILPALKNDSLVVSLQNGICIDELSAIVGLSRTVGCVVGWGATMTKHGEYDMTSGGDFVIGAAGKIARSKLYLLQGIMQHVAPTKITGDIYSELYSKLIINACITTLGAISGIRLGKMLRKKKLRNIFIGIINEAMAVASAMQLDVPAYGGRLDFYRFTNGNGLFADIRRHLIIMVIGFRYRRLKSSSLQSLERGKPTEVDFFNGYIIRKAVENNLEAPLNEYLTKIVKEIESGIRKSECSNFNDPYFAKFA